MPQRIDADRFRTYFLAFALAATLTSLNTIKPPCIDDPAYLAVARQIAVDPFDPYGFEQFWYQAPQPANEVLAPPVVPYWLGLGIGLLGERPVLLKVWLVPVALVLTLSVCSLLRRFARGVEEPALVGIVLSPVVLPGFNFMLDVPALALVLASVAVFLRALDRDSMALVVVVGALAGLAAQTKYTGTVSWPVLVIAAMLRRRLAAGFSAVGIAATVFASWEFFTRWHYGESHFLIALQGSSVTWEDKLYMPLWGFRILGAVGMPLVLLALAALCRRPAVVLTASIILIVCLAVLAVYPDTLNSVWVSEELRHGIGLPRMLFQAWATALAGLLGVAAWRLAVRSDGWPRRLRRDSTMLLAWLAVEMIGYVALTNFSASRRVLGFTVVASLLLAHLASRTCRARRGRTAVWLAALGGAVTGLVIAFIDVADSRLEPRAVRLAAAHIRGADPSARIWFVGHWGTQYEAERLGFQPLIPGRSVLRQGDWFIDSPSWVAKQDYRADERMGPPVHVIRLDRALRLRTLPPYYGGDQPIEWWPSPMIEVRIYQVQATWRP